MTRRTDFEAAYKDWLANVGRQLRTHRQTLALTQAQAAHRCLLDIKQYQDLEYGRRPVSTRTLFSVASAMGLQLAGLAVMEAVGGEAETAAPESVIVSGLHAIGWQTRAEKYGRFSFPVYDIVATGGPVTQPGQAEVLAWAAAPPRIRVDPADHFVAQIRGHSMSPRVPDGSWCLFRQPVLPPLIGKIVLLQQGSGSADDFTWQLKRVGAIEVLPDGRLAVTLRSEHPDYGPLVRVVDGEGDFAAVGEFVTTLDETVAGLP